MMIIAFIHFIFSFIFKTEFGTNKFTSLFGIKHIALVLVSIRAFTQTYFFQNVMVPFARVIFNQFGRVGPSLFLCADDHSSIRVVMVKPPIVCVVHHVQFAFECHSVVNIVPRIKLVSLNDQFFCPQSCVCLKEEIKIHCSRSRSTESIKEFDLFHSDTRVSRERPIIDVLFHLEIVLAEVQFIDIDKSSVSGDVFEVVDVVLH